MVIYFAKIKNRSAFRCCTICINNFFFFLSLFNKLINSLLDLINLLEKSLKVEIHLTLIFSPFFKSCFNLFVLE